MTFEEWIESPIPLDMADLENLWNGAKAEGARDEREACAKLAEGYDPYNADFRELADAIRARREGETLAD